MSRIREAPWIVAPLLAACGLALAALAVALGANGATAQMQAPPFGWDMWEPGWRNRDVWQSKREDESLRWRLTRHETFLRDGVPAAYQGAHNPLAETPDVVRQGGAIYAERCARCHDPTGMGHGDAGLALYPSPALLAELVRMPQAVDEYLLWAISEGGTPFGTKMPAFKDALTREQIWQVITYMRAGFPDARATGQQ
jgi:mono/diheme cytochrome c family protein